MRGNFAALPDLARSKSAYAELVEARTHTLRQAQGERFGTGSGERLGKARK